MSNLRPNRHSAPAGAWDAKKCAMMLSLLKARREAIERGKPTRSAARLNRNERRAG